MLILLYVLQKCKIGVIVSDGEPDNVKCLNCNRKMSPAYLKAAEHTQKVVSEALAKPRTAQIESLIKSASKYLHPYNNEFLYLNQLYMKNLLNSDKSQEALEIMENQILPAIENSFSCETLRYAQTCKQLAEYLHSKCKDPAHGVKKAIERHKNDALEVYKLHYGEHYELFM